MRRWRCAVLSIVLGVTIRPSNVGAEPPVRPPSSILIDAVTGLALSEQDADATHPAGPLSQLMVLLLGLEESKLGALRLDEPIIASPTAAREEGKQATNRAAAAAAADTRIPLRAGRPYILSDLLKAVALNAASDATVAAAEAIAGSVPACLDLMNARAQKLGMQATQYGSIGGRAPAAAAGDAAIGDATTARDQARLAQALTRHAEILQWGSVNGLPFDQGTIVLRNTNRLVGTVAGVDGIQAISCSGATGGTATYSVVATAQRGALRLIAIVLDASGSVARYSTAAELLEWGFAHYERLDVVKKGEPLDLPIRIVRGVVSQITPIAGDTFSLLRRRDEERDLQVRYQLPTVLAAPLARQQQIGEIIVEEKGQLMAVIPIVSSKSVASTSLLSAALP